MTKIALLPPDICSRGTYLDSRRLPTNYMEDFTLLGFVVDRYQPALEILRSAGFVLEEQSGGADISVDSFSLLPEIADLLAANGIRCDLSDIADTLYQA